MNILVAVWRIPKGGLCSVQTDHLRVAPRTEEKPSLQPLVFLEPIGTFPLQLRLSIVKYALQGRFVTVVTCWHLFIVLLELIMD